MLIVPLERLTISDSSLDGSRGTNRAPVNPADPVVNTDLEATKKFLAMHRDTPTTQRNYTKEVERLILWAINVKLKPLSSLNATDMEEFLEFLANPHPISVWASTRKFPREFEGWRPFVATKKKAIEGSKSILVAGLGTSSQLTAFSILSAFLTWLVDYGYLVRNPLRQLKKQRKKIRADGPPADALGKVEHFLDEEMWASFKDAIEALPKQSVVDQDRYERAKFISELMFYLAPRPHELANGRMNSFCKINGRWWWKVVGKGKKAARIPAVPGMIEALIRYRNYLGLTPLPLDDDDSPLLRSLRNGSAITARQLNYILDDLFEVAAKYLDQKAAEQTNVLDRAEYQTRASKIRKASAHWGRHTSITFQVKSGMDLRVTQLNARHADARMTEHYTHEDEEHWFKESEKLRSD